MPTDNSDPFLHVGEVLVLATSRDDDSPGLVVDRHAEAVGMAAYLEAMKSDSLRVAYSDEREGAANDQWEAPMKEFDPASAAE